MSAKDRELIEILAGKPLLTRADIMRRYQISARTFAYWKASGRLPRPVQTHGERWRAADLQTWEKNHGTKRTVS